MLQLFLKPINIGDNLFIAIIGFQLTSDMLTLAPLAISSLLLPLLLLQCGGKKKGGKADSTTTTGANKSKSAAAPPSAPVEAPKPGEPAKAEEGGDGNYEDVQVNPNNVPDAPK